MRDRSAPLTIAEIGTLAWGKMGGLLPAVVQDRGSGQVLMLGYMSVEALAKTLESGLVTFYSRSTQRLWQKGESSGNSLRLAAVHEDCDGDALLVFADPEGPTCHLGTASCFGGEPEGPWWLSELSAVVKDRAASGNASSYTRHLIDSGLARIAQKIGEEAVEVSLAAVSLGRTECAEETADLLYHLAVLMQAKGFSWNDVIAVLKGRHARASSSTVES